MLGVVPEQPQGCAGACPAGACKRLVHRYTSPGKTLRLACQGRMGGSPRPYSTPPLMSLPGKGGTEPGGGGGASRLGGHVCSSVGLDGGGAGCWVGEEAAADFHWPLVTVPRRVLSSYLTEGKLRQSGGPWSHRQEVLDPGPQCWSPVILAMPLIRGYMGEEGAGTPPASL